jgi:hypothetical protein
MNYAELKNLTIKYLHRTDLNTYIPTWLEFAHKQIQKGKIFRYQQKRFNPIDLTVNTEKYVIADCKRVENIFVYNKDTDKTEAVLVYHISPYYDELKDKKVNYDFPVIYKHWGNNYYVAPSVKANDIYQLIVEGFFELSFYFSDADEDYLSKNYALLLISGALLYAEPFIKDDTQTKLWAEMYTQHYATYLEEEKIILYSNSQGGHL